MIGTYHEPLAWRMFAMPELSIFPDRLSAPFRRRPRLHRVPVLRLLAGGVPVPRLRPPQGLDLPMRQVRQADLGDLGRHHARQQVGPTCLVLGCLAVGRQVPPGHGRSRAQPPIRLGGSRRNHDQSPDPERPTGRQPACLHRNRHASQTHHLQDVDPAGSNGISLSASFTGSNAIRLFPRTS